MRSIVLTDKPKRLDSQTVFTKESINNHLNFQTLEARKLPPTDLLEKQRLFLYSPPKKTETISIKFAHEDLLYNNSKIQINH